MDRASQRGGRPPGRPLLRGRYRAKGRGVNRANTAGTLPGRVVGASQPTPLTTPDRNNDNAKDDKTEPAGSKALSETTVNQPGPSRPIPRITFGFFDDNTDNEGSSSDDMSFAAKAREAEYNAAAAAKLRARQFESSTLGGGPSSMRPISLGAFTKPNTTTRNKGHKGWKPLTEEDMDGDPSTPSRQADDMLASPDRGVTLPHSGEDKGKEKDTSHRRLTPTMLPPINTNLSPDAPTATLIGHIPPAASFGYNVPRDATGRFFGYSRHPNEPNWRDKMGFDAETDALMPNYFTNPPAYLNADPLSNFPELHSGNPDFLPSFIPPNNQDQTRFGGHPDYYHFDPQEPFYYHDPESFVEDPFMGTPHYPGRYGFNSFNRGFFNAPLRHDTYNHGRDLNPPAGMMMDPQYHRRLPQNTFNEPMHAQHYQGARLPTPRGPAHTSSQFQNVTSTEENPAHFDRRRLTSLQRMVASPMQSDNQRTPRGLTSFCEVDSTGSSPLARLVRVSTADVTAPSSVSASSRRQRVTQPPPGFERSLAGARSGSQTVTSTVQPGDLWTRRAVLLPPAAAGEPFRSRLPAAMIDAHNIETFTIEQWVARQSRMTAEEWFEADNRGERDTRDHVERVTLAAAEQRVRDRAAATEYHGMPATLKELVAQSEEDKVFDTSSRLLGGALATLQSYVAGDRSNQAFARFGPPPEWAIDKSTGANLSFFEEDWGTPPRRVGRDRRYVPLPEDQLAADDEIVVRGRRQQR